MAVWFVGGVFMDLPPDEKSQNHPVVKRGMVSICETVSRVIVMNIVGSSCISPVVLAMTDCCDASPTSSHDTVRPPPGHPPVRDRVCFAWSCFDAGRHHPV